MATDAIEGEGGALEEASHVQVRIKNADARSSDHDGIPVLVDRLWRRGLNKADAVIDVRHRGIAPSDALRDDLTHRLGKEAAS